MEYAMIFALVLICIWQAYRIGVRDGHKDADVYEYRPQNRISVDVALIRAVIEQEGWVIIQPEDKGEAKPWKH